MSINLIMGCMFSGKTSALINVAKISKLINRKVLLINYIEDTRYSSSGNITTHDSISIECIPCGKDITVILNTQDYIDSEVICVNEGQFFDNLVHFCTTACNEGKEVHICGLDGDYLKCPFGELLNLIPHCDDVKKLKALCMSCKNGTLASFTKRIGDSKVLIEIGSTEMYIPVCRKCYNK